jgi:PAS domain S-box-containing protein
MADFLAGGGEMGERMRALDWSRTPLGAPDAWPQSLRTAVSMLLPSKAQICLFWGPDYIVFYNDAYRPVFGGKHPRMLGQPGRVAWSEIWDEVLRALLEGVVRSGEAFWATDMLFYLDRHGFVEETYFDVSYDPVRVESGEVGGVYCIVTETTGRVVGERRLALLRDLARKATARSAREACLRAVETIATRPEDLPYAAVYLGGELQCATSGQAPELVRELPVGGNGRLVAGLNPRRPFDEQYRAFLELVADQLSSAIADAQAYEEERKRAEALAQIDRAKTAFFSNVSHEFRTPLTLMLGPLADGLVDAEAPLPPAQRERQELVLRSALRLQKLVNTLLDFSRIEAGRARASYVATDLSGFTANLASTFRSAVEKAGLELEVDCPALPEPAWIDREMWEKIVLNLLSNAFKFTFEGRIAVSVRMGEQFVLEVRDSGAGIPAAELPRIFERFHRVEGARSRTHEGTGIGLSLVQELAKLHGGAVRVESVEGQGSTFTVSIPRGRAHLPAEHVGTASGLASTALGPASYVQEALGWLAQPQTEIQLNGNLRPRIVWADDNADMREYVRGLLAPRYEVEALADGEAALAAARRRRPALVLADVMMPKLDGLGLARALRADEALRDVPVVLLSARAGEESRIEGLSAGADAYLQKPFGARELLARVDTLIESAELRSRIRAERADLGRLFAETPLPIAVLRGSELVFEMANPAYVEVVDGREVVGKTLFEALPEARGQGFDELLREVMRTGQPYVGREVRLRLRRAGALQDAWFTFIYAPLRDADGATERVIAIVNDVTEQVRARERVARSEARYREFLAMLSHELRNPLAPIANAVSLLREPALEPQLAERAHGILERQLKHLIRLVDDLLDIARISRGEIGLQRRPVSLAQVVNDAIETSRPLIESGGHQLVVGPASASAMVFADPVRLAQVIANLLNNAARYTPRGGRIEVDATLEAGAHGGQAAVTVRDNGVGIEPAELPRLFEMFQQSEATRGRVPGGLGVGLGLARQLAELHGGTLEGRSEGAGRGAEFILRVPLLLSTKSESEVNKPEPVVAAARRILVVEDNADAAEGFAAHLRLHGHEVRTAGDGEEALAIAREFRPQVALVDIGLPGMSGYELAHRLRDTPALLIALTGHGQKQDRMRAREAGFHHHFVKPADPRDIQAAIGEWRPQ